MRLGDLKRLASLARGCVVATMPRAPYTGARRERKPKLSMSARHTTRLRRALRSDLKEKKDEKEWF